MTSDDIKNSNMKNLSKKTIKQMQDLGYKGVPTIDEAVRWIREEKHYYILIIPEQPGVWYHTIVDVKHRHVDDGKLISFVCERPFKTYDDAAVNGISFVVDSLYNAIIEVALHNNDEEWLRQREEDAKYLGLKK